MGVVIVGIDVPGGMFSLLEEEDEGRTGVIDKHCFDDMLFILNLLKGSGCFGIFRFGGGKKLLELMTTTFRC